MALELDEQSQQVLNVDPTASTQDINSSGNRGVTAAFVNQTAKDYPDLATTWNNNYIVDKWGPSLVDPFFAPSSQFSPLGKNRWSALFPFELIVLEKSSSGAAKDGWFWVDSFVLPIPPQEMTIQTPIAINQTVTMGGVVEEHNGAPIRIIQMSGTTGVTPLKLKKSDEPPPAVRAAIQVVGTATGNTALANIVTNVPDMKTDENVSNSSGYNQFRLLQRFLEAYIVAKKEKKNSNLRLGLALWKERVVYLVTPTMFNVRRSVSSPLEYMYDLQFRAFARIPAGAMMASQNNYLNPANDKDWITKALNLLRTARAAIRLVVRAIRFVRATVAKVMEIARQAILFIKDMVNAIVELINLPKQIVQDFKRLVKDSWNQLGDAIRATLGNDPTLIEANNRTANQGQMPQPSPDEMPSGLDLVFENPDDYGPFFEKLTTSDFVLDENLLAKIDAEMARARALTPADFASFRAQTLDTMMEVANMLGVGDSTVDSMYGLTEPQATRQLTLDEFSLLSALNDMSDAFALLALRRPYDRPTTVDYIAGFATASGIAFQKPVSKFAVPFPYEGTLEQLAYQYLGNVDRWVEIAAVNGLREPYVDETGFRRMLSQDGKENYVVVANKTNLRINQTVWIESVYVPREKRHIIGIDDLGPTAFKITLDGNNDLHRYTLAGDAFLHAFLPDTVNSLQSIYIPSNQQGITSDELTRVPGVDAFDPLLKAGGIDLMLTEQGDLVITPEGDVRLSYGLHNIQQYAKLALSSPRGSLLRHPTFGFPIIVGTSIADTNAEEIAAQVKDMFGNDPIFNKLNNIRVAVQGPTLRVGMALTVFGSTRPIDLSINVLR